MIYTKFKSLHQVQVAGGGGVILYVKESIQAYEIKLEREADCDEAVWCKIVSGNSKLTIGLVYRSPNINEEDNSRKKVIYAYVEVILISFAPEFVFYSELLVHYLDFLDTNTSHRKKDIYFDITFVSIATNVVYGRTYFQLIFHIFGQHRYPSFFFNVNKK